MEIVKYKYTWCDYLTKCKHFPNIEVGSYECACCPCSGGFTLDPNFETGKYFTEYEGTVECNYNKE